MTVARLHKYLLKKWRFPNGRVWKRKFEDDILSPGPTKEKFAKIYENNYWLSTESASGPGSTLKSTKNLRDHLPTIVEDFHISSIFDGPCGDFNWMRQLLPNLQLGGAQIDYVGGDIVSAIVDDNNRRFHQDGVRFIQIDITSDKLPKADLMICRDCLQHLSYEVIEAFIANFLRSEIDFLLTSSHINEPFRFDNLDIETGGFRPIDLFSSPFDFPRDPLRRLSDWLPPEAEKEICLWSREQLLAARSSRLNHRGL